MDVRHCRKCGRLFNYIAGPFICPSCRDKQEEKFQIVKKYIQQHGRATINEVSEECEVEVQQIQAWIRQERLEFTDDSPIGIPCESCGKMIGSGKYCSECKDKMMRGLNSAMGKRGVQVESPSEVRKAKENRMRFLDKTQQ